MTGQPENGVGRRPLPGNAEKFGLLSESLRVRF